MLLSIHLNKMSAAASLAPSYQRSPKSAERRRSLFPSEKADSEGDSDLGHISPLSFDSSYEEDELRKFSNSPTINDYDIIGIVENDNGATFSTPSNNSSEIPTNKRKLSPSNSPNSSKQMKLENKNSKVRTTLFPKEDISVPVKSFYSNIENIMDKILNKRKLYISSPPKQPTQRKSGGRRKVGEINAGVEHKMRKPRQRKPKKMSIPKVSSDSAALTDFILTLKEMRNQKTKLIENKENATEPVQKPEKLITPAIYVERPDLPKKRTRTTESECESKKKFFKFTKPKAIVSLTSNIRLEIDKDKDSVVTMNPVKQDSNKTPVIEYDPNDFSMEEPSMISTNIDKILLQLDDSDNRIVLEAHNSVLASENSILLHEQPAPCAANLILSPISQMCDVTSGLALSSPKRARNLTAVLDQMPSGSAVDKRIEEVNLYPIFYPGIAKHDEVKLDKTPVVTRKKLAKLDEKQMLLDASQKKFGVIQCTECGFIYHLGDPMDEEMHMNYHEARHILKFNGWKNERVVANFGDMGRIVQIVPGDLKSWIKRANDLIELINNELGCFKTEINQNFDGQIYLYIKNKYIVGCVLAVPKQLGYKMLASGESEVDICSDSAEPIKCGIARLWVSHNHRNQGIARALMDAVRRHFVFGYVLQDSDIALSAPTKQGIDFAKKYFNTPNFLIYLE